MKQPSAKIQLLKECKTPLLYSFQKSIATEIAAIDALLANVERQVKRAFLDYLKKAKSKETLKAVRKLLQDGNVDGVVNLFERLSKGLSQPLTAAMIHVASEEMRSLAPKAVRAAFQQNGTSIPQIAIQFDASNAHAAALAQELTARFVRQINEQQRKIILELVQQGQLNGEGPLATARKIRDNIGLTERQYQAVLNYRSLLENQDLQALSRTLRDKRFDRTVRNNFKEDEPLTQSQINNMVDRYRNRYLAYRADTIARTEAHEIVNVARQEGLQQTIEQAGIDQSSVRQKWRATRDNRTRDTHSALDNQVSDANGYFTSPSGARLRFPGDPLAPAEEKINCRCTTTVTFER